SEQCDDGNRAPDDGCDAACYREARYVCAEPGEPCELTVCGDGDKQGDEGCDDGNVIAGDGCGPTCQNEPTFVRDSNNVPVAQLTCGDGLITGIEACDDGNAVSGDGCSATCEEEAGFACSPLLALPSSVQMAVTYRDFKTDETSGGHPDFENVNSSSASIPGVPCTTGNQA